MKKSWPTGASSCQPSAVALAAYQEVLLLSNNAAGADFLEARIDMLGEFGATGQALDGERHGDDWYRGPARRVARAR
ncbi:MAG: hypothetical protein R3A46_10235 [Thermomicrobiales bacterium]